MPIKWFICLRINQEIRLRLIQEYNASQRKGQESCRNKGVIMTKKRIGKEVVLNDDNAQSKRTDNKSGF